MSHVHCANSRRETPDHQWQLVDKQTCQLRELPQQIL
jgi:hypothetical protein